MCGTWTTLRETKVGALTQWQKIGGRWPQLTPEQDPDGGIRAQWDAAYARYRSLSSCVQQRGLQDGDMIELDAILADKEVVRQLAMAAIASTGKRHVASSRATTDKRLESLTQGAKLVVRLAEGLGGDLGKERNAVDSTVNQILVHHLLGIIIVYVQAGFCPCCPAQSCLWEGNLGSIVIVRAPRHRNRRMRGSLLPAAARMQRHKHLRHLRCRRKQRRQLELNVSAAYFLKAWTQARNWGGREW